MRKEKEEEEYDDDEEEEEEEEEEMRKKGEKEIKEKAMRKSRMYGEATKVTLVQANRKFEGLSTSHQPQNQIHGVFCIQCWQG